MTPYTLVVHLIGGGQLHVRCTDHLIIDRGVDHHGVGIPPALEVTQPADASRRLAYVHFGAIAALEVLDREPDDGQ